MPVYEAIDITLDIIFKMSKLSTIGSIRSQRQQQLKIIVNDIPFYCCDKIYALTDGMATESSLGVILAHHFMLKLEQELDRFSTCDPLI